MVGRVGGDVFGPQLLNSLAAAGVDISGVRVNPEESSGIAVIGIDESAQNRITQKLQGLVITCVLGCLSGVRTMRQRAAEPLGNRKAISQAPLKQGQTFRTPGGDHIGSVYCLKTTHAFVPPKPRELDIATLTGIVRASFGT